MKNKRKQEINVISMDQSKETYMMKYITYALRQKSNVGSFPPDKKVQRNKQ